MDLSDFRVDPDLKRDGVTIPFGSYTEFTIRSSSDEKFVSYWNKIKKPHQKEIDTERLSEETGRELLSRAIAQRLVLGWKFLVIPKSMWEDDFADSGIEVKDAKHKDFDRPMVEIPYSKKACYTILNHPDGGYDPLRTWIMNQASDLANFQRQDFEDDLGN